MQLKLKYLPYHLGQLPWDNIQNGKILQNNHTYHTIQYMFISDYNLILPPWLCQPLIRLLPVSNLDGIETHQEGNKSKTDEKEVRLVSNKIYSYIFTFEISNRTLKEVLMMKIVLTL